MTKLVLLRHGESVWNRQNRFTGWADVDLTEKGVAEARDAGKALKEAGLTFDVAFTSVLKRAIRTLWIVLDEMDLMWIPVQRSWRLNERHYGDLQGLNKIETVNNHGAAQVQVWRRSYDIPPPPLAPGDDRSPRRDQKYRDLSDNEIPASESLADTVARFLPYWRETIEPTVKGGKRAIIVAHGNSLRALIKHLDNVSDEKIVSLNMPTGIPLVYELDENLKPLKHYFLGDPDQVARAIESVANQTKAKE